MPTELLKTLTYLTVHLTVGFTVAYLLTGSAEIAGGIALIERLLLPRAGVGRPAVAEACCARGLA